MAAGTTADSKRPGNQKRRRVQKQCYSRKAKIDASEAQLAQLNDAVAALSQERQALLETHDAVQLGLACANGEHAQAVAARCALVPAAAHLSRSLAISCLSDLPPISAWSPSRVAAASKFSTDQIRFVTFKSYQQAAQLVKSGASMDQVRQACERTQPASAYNGVSDTPTHRPASLTPCPPACRPASRSWASTCARLCISL